jgi:hypothetical protein
MNIYDIILAVYFVVAVLVFTGLVLVIKPNSLFYDKYHIFWRLISALWPVIVGAILFSCVVFVFIETGWFLIYVVNWKNIYLNLIRLKLPIKWSALQDIDFFEDRKPHKT